MNVADREKEGGHTPYLSTPKKIAKSNFLKAIPWRAQLRRAGRFLREICHHVYMQPRLHGTASRFIYTRTGGILKPSGLDYFKEKQYTISMDYSDASKKDDLILQFVQKNVLQAFDLMTSEEDYLPSSEVITTIAQTFCPGNPIAFFTDIVSASNIESEKKLIHSFHNNLKLLVEKTWVEPSDATVKEQVLYRIDKLCATLQERNYNGCYIDFISVLTDVVYLMFGSQAKSADFTEYALRIDPEFGIFWWYVQSLPRKPIWGNEKSRVATMLGMYFLANY